MLKFTRSLLVAGAILAAGAGAFAYGYNGSLDGVAADIATAVAANDASALKMQNWLDKESTKLSKDFVTFSKIAATAKKTGYAAITEEQLSTEFSGMVLTSAQFGAAAIQRMAADAGSDPKKIKKQLITIAKEAKFLVKYSKVWGDTADPNKVNLAKAAIAYSQIQKLYEVIDKKFPPIG